MGKRFIFIVLTLILGLAVIVGCGGKQAPASTSGGEAGLQVSKDPITLKFYTSQNSVYANEEGFDQQIGRFIKEKFPYITIQHIHRGKDTQYSDLLTAGIIPDIILESTANIQSAIVTNGLQYDLTDQIKKNKFDSNRLDAAAMAQIKNSNPEGKIFGLPFTLSNFIMFYNKDLFDKFGVPYPKDGMTYDETYELAKKLSRIDGGTEYRGLLFHPTLMMLWNQLSLSPLSLKEDKAELNTEQWKTLVDNYKRFYEIPNNKYTNVDDFPKGDVAMGIHVSEKIVSWYEANKSLNFDIVSVPSFKGAPNTGFQPNTYALFVSQQSKVKDQAFQVISALLSDEVQTELSKQGVVTPLVSKSVHQVFGQNLPQLKGKNTQAIFYNKNAFPPAPRAANLLPYSVSVGKVFDSILKENKDVNTALRTVDDESNQNIAKLKEAQAKK